MRPFSTEDLAGLTLGKGVQWREHEELPFGRSLLLSKEGSFVSIRARRGTLRVAFLRHPWSGRAEVRIGRQDHVVDLYLSETRNQVVEFLCEEESGCVVISSVGRAPKSPAKGSEVWIHTFEWVDTGSDTEIFTAWKNETCSIVQGYEGDFLTLNNDTAISQTLREKGIWAPQDADLFKKLIKPGMVVADIGANSGHHSVVFSKAVGPSGLVIACEPQRIFFELLSANLILNRCQNVIPVHCALGAESRRLRLWPIDYSQPNNFGALGVSQEGGEPLLDHSGEEVDVVTADDLLGRVLPAGRKVDLLKIDVQTFELFVLRGAERVLNQMRPVIFTEISPFWMRKTGYDYREIYDLLSRYSYQVYDPHVSLEVQAAVREWSGDQQEEWDILAVPGIRVSP